MTTTLLHFSMILNQACFGEEELNPELILLYKWQ
jgi:hypothetical protein